MRVPVTNDTSRELIPDDVLLQSEDVFEVREEFEVIEERLVEEFEFLILLRDIASDLCLPPSEGYCRKIYGKLGIIFRYPGSNSF